jgi:hypothetical protein
VIVDFNDSRSLGMGTPRHLSETRIPVRAAVAAAQAGLRNV